MDCERCGGRMLGDLDGIACVNCGAAPPLTPQRIAEIEEDRELMAINGRRDLKVDGPVPSRHRRRRTRDGYHAAKIAPREQILLDEQARRAELRRQAELLGRYLNPITRGRASAG